MSYLKTEDGGASARMGARRFGFFHALAAGRGRSAALTGLVTAGLLVAGAGMVQADDISNGLDGTIDSTVEAMPLNVGGPAGTTTLYVSPTGGDGKTGCNLTGSTSVTVALASGNTAVATVSPGTVTFTSCGDTKMLTVTPVSTGSAGITARVINNTTPGSFNVAPVSFTVNVAAPANTAPVVSVGGVTAGSSYSKGSVPTATCSVSDKEDGNKTFPATLGAVSGPDMTDGIGTQTATCSYTDAGGASASESATYNIVDSTPPVIDYTLTPGAPDGLNGWYKAGPALVWSVTEAESPNSLMKTGCVDQTILADQAPTTYSCSAASAGGSGAQQDATIAVDGTAPSVSYTSATGTQGSNGWYITPVTATFTATDATSGPATDSQTAGSSGEGAAVAVDSPAFSDMAGNITPAGASQQSFKIDLTDPVASFDSILAPSYFGSVPAAPTCTSTDSTSGPANCTVTGYSAAVGTHTLTATAMDMAGRLSTTSQDYTVLPWTLKGFYQPVDMGGAFNTVKAGSTVPVKFEIFAGSTELTDTSYVSMGAKQIACSNSAVLDEIELLASGNTSLRYDSTSGQFIYNWKTPASSGACYALTMTATDGSTLSANFKLK
jgi:hypothetical protein